jgi:hypothetical protein
MVKLNYNPKILEEKEYKTKVSEELKENREITAFLLIHAYIEAYLLEILFYSGKKSNERLNKQAIDNIGRINFNDLLHINLLLGTIPFDLYKKIYELNKRRNKIAHELLSINIADAQIRNKLKKTTEKAIEFCDNLSSIYMQELNEKTKQLEANKNA